MIGELINGLFGLGNTAVEVAANSAEGAVNRQFQSDEASIARLFNAAEAEKARLFNAAEAEKARSWQEKFYQNYQSPSAMVQLYSSAGLNPALMYEGASGGSPVSSSAASGPAASSSGSPSGSLVHHNINLLGDILASAKAITDLKNQQRVTDAQVENLNADTAAKKQSVTESESRIELNKTLSQLNSVKVDEVVANTDKLKAQFDTELMQQAFLKSGINANDAKAALDMLQKVLLETEERYRPRLLRAQAELLESERALADARKELTDGEASLIPERKREFEAKSSQLEQEVYEAKKTFEIRFLQAAEHLRADIGNADYANGKGKRFTVEQIQEGAATLVKAVGLAVGVSTGTAAAGKVASSAYTVSSTVSR